MKYLGELASIPTPIPEPVTFEFRVLGDPGNISRADIRWSTTQEGTSLVSTQLPWTARVRTLEGSSFLTLTARQTSFDPISFLHVQILVNDRVFREASAPGPDASVSVSGTFTK